MSKRNQTLLGILLLVVLWFGLNIGLLFFNDLLRSDHWRSWFYNSYASYPMIRIVQPFVTGVGILYIWIKAKHTENTGLAWLCLCGGCHSNLYPNCASTQAFKRRHQGNTHHHL